MWSLTFSQRVRLRIAISWKFFVAIILPVALLPLVFIHDEVIRQDGLPDEIMTKFKTLYILIIMAVYWAFEIIPLPVTALLPLVLLPALGVQSAYTVSQNYAKESNMIFLGGVIVALGVEYCGLHNRIALRVMNIVGSSPVQLLFGVMIIVALLSMWVSATSCVAILVPVVCALIDEIHESPEILSNEEVRRLSHSQHASVNVNLHPEGSLPSGLNNTDNRRGSLANSTTDSGNRTRRNTSVFGNLGLSSPLPDAMLSPNLLSDAGFRRHSHITPTVSPVPRPSRVPTISPTLDNDDKGYDNPHPNGSISTGSIQAEVEEIQKDIIEEELKKEQEKETKRSQIKKMFLFGMAYAANIGGTAVITGTSPNKVFKEVIKPLDVSNGGKLLDMTFFTWMALNIPAVLLNVIIAWIYLSISYYGIPNRTNWPFLRKLCCLRKKKSKDQDSEEDVYLWRSREVAVFLKTEYQNLGKISFHELSVSLVFILVVLLWIFRDPEIIDGWGLLTPGVYTGDSTGAMLGVVLLFILPKDLSFIFGKNKDKCKYESLLEWKFVTTKTPWGVFLLLGSGFALADASLYSGLSEWIGKELELLSGVPQSAILLIVVVITSISTQFVSNVATANILLPIMASLSRSLNLHPLYLTVPVALTCQYAFLFPVATPSNTIVFAAGNFSTMEMVRTGLFLNLICIAVLYVNTVTYGDWLFEYSEYEYANANTIAP